MNPRALPRPDRRTALKWMLTAAGVLAARPRHLLAADVPAPVAGPGYGTDPDLMRAYGYGDYWPLTLTDEQRRLAAALCTLIIPADDQSPSAADLGVHDFIDEWISAPYPDQQADRTTILEGLVWIDAEAQRRFQRAFADLDEQQQSAIADDICLESRAAPSFRAAAVFFKRYRELTAAGFYTTPEGMRDIGYVGNVPSATFAGPPPELIARLGLDQ
jgi:hypothetical protein